MATNPNSRRGDDAAAGRVVRGKFFYLLMAMIVLLVAYPYVGTDIAGRVFVNALNLCVLVLAIFAIQRSRRNLLIGVLLAIPTLTGQCLYLATGEKLAVRVAAVGLLIFFTFIVTNILLYVLRGAEVTADKICGAICAYMLFALMWTTAYALVESTHPGSFTPAMARTSEGRVDFYALLYFSIVTLTTTGYGDIVPITTYARSLANLEQLVGVFYVAILVARLAGLYPHRVDRGSK
ncbi:MAG: two pore domain potassium channel family protein [Planctomycetes bacterium]|nr:two pore domain potassium channel family protein [Planctomycetota bacterium]MBI3834023.1 two pore domain potassium channel family protein [Planctomycetota bacterium]